MLPAGAAERMPRVCDSGKCRELTRLNAVPEILGVVGLRKVLGRNRDTQEPTEGFPALLDVKEQETVCRDDLLDRLDMAMEGGEDLLFRRWDLESGLFDNGHNHLKEWQ